MSKFFQDNCMYHSIENPFNSISQDKMIEALIKIGGKEWKTDGNSYINPSNITKYRIYFNDKILSQVVYYDVKSNRFVIMHDNSALYVKIIKQLRENINKEAVKEFEFISTGEFNDLYGKPIGNMPSYPKGTKTGRSECITPNVQEVDKIANDHKNYVVEESNIVQVTITREEKPIENMMVEFTKEYFNKKREYIVNFKYHYDCSIVNTKSKELSVKAIDEKSAVDYAKLHYPNVNVSSIIDVKNDIEKLYYDEGKIKLSNNVINCKNTSCASSMKDGSCKSVTNQTDVIKCWSYYKGKSELC